MWCQAQQALKVNNMWTCIRLKQVKMTGSSYQHQTISADCTKHQRASFFTLQQRQHSSRKMRMRAFSSLYDNENNNSSLILTAVLFQTNNVKDNQIKRLCWFLPPVKANHLRVNLRVLHRQTMALIDWCGFKNKLLDVTSGGSRLGLWFNYLSTIYHSKLSVSTHI